MKNLKTFILESQSELLAMIKRMMGSIDYSKLKSHAGEQDPNKFDVQKENELLLISNINEGDFKFVGTSEYYNIETGKNFDNLSIKEKADYDSKNGDIIILDKDNNIKFRIDVKISDKYLGAISLGSLTKFDKDGYYLLICKTGKFFKVISHKDVVDNVKSGKLKLNSPINKYKGYDVKWEGENLTSEYFIKGADLRKI